MSGEERSIIWPPRPYPWPSPWPGPGPFNPFPENRSETGSASSGEINSLIANGPEILKRLYFRPDYQALIKEYVPVMIKQLEQDPEANKALQELLDKQSQGERIIPLLIAIAAGAALGYWAESKHH